MLRKYLPSFICVVFLGCMVIAPFQNCAPSQGGDGSIYFDSLSPKAPYIDYASGDELVYHPGQSVILNVQRVHGARPEFSWFFVEKLSGGRVIDRPVPEEYIKLGGSSLRFALTDRHVAGVESIEQEKYIYVALVATNQYGTDRYEFEVLVRPHGRMALQALYCMGSKTKCEDGDSYRGYTRRIVLAPGQSLWLRAFSENPLGGRYSWHKRQSNKHRWTLLDQNEDVYRVFSSFRDWGCKKSRTHEYRASARREGSDKIDKIVFKVKCP